MWIKELDDLIAAIVVRYKLDDNFIIVAGRDVSEMTPRFQNYYTQDQRHRVRFLIGESFYNRDYDDVSDSTDEGLNTTFYHSCFNKAYHSNSDKGTLLENIMNMYKHDTEGDDGRWDQWCIIDLNVTLKALPFQQYPNEKNDGYKLRTDHEMNSVIVKAFEPYKHKSA